MTPPSIYEFRLRIEHASASPERRAEIRAELLSEFDIAFRELSENVGVWEPAKKGKK